MCRPKQFSQVQKIISAFGQVTVRNLSISLSGCRAYLHSYVRKTVTAHYLLDRHTPHRTVRLAEVIFFVREALMQSPKYWWGHFIFSREIIFLIVHEEQHLSMGLQDVPSHIVVAVLNGSWWSCDYSRKLKSRAPAHFFMHTLCPGCAPK